MRTRSAVAGVIVAVMVGGLGVTPVGADDETGETARRSRRVAAQPDPAAPPDGGDTTTPTGDGDAAPEPTDGTTGPSDPAPVPSDPPPAEPGTSGPGSSPPATGVPPEGSPSTSPPATSPATSPAGPTTATSASDPGGSSGSATSPPAVVSSQDATVDAAGSAVADSGHNTAANGSVQVIVVDQAAVAPGGATGGSADPTAGNTADGSNTGVGLALVVSGNAAAIGGTTDDSISQKALVKAVGTGEIEIIQIALIVNLGVGVANTGGNTADGPRRRQRHRRRPGRRRRVRRHRAGSPPTA